MPSPCATGTCGLAPTVSPSYAPPFAPTYQAPQSVVTAPPCGCQQYADNSCPSDVYSSGTCGCGNPIGGYSSDSYGPSNYAPSVSDPYLSSGQIMGDSGYSLGAPVESYPSSPIPTGEWNARKIDTDGNQILWEEPLPSGANPQ
ncbi:hypothetical protein [Rubripirellula reticaptiva]|nr:hypothetical protein [Rubripirellula reticaptiva]